MNFEETLFLFSSTFFLNCSSLDFDQSAFDVTAVDVTAISTPLERVPLYTVMSEKEPIILLKSSQAASSSDRLSFGTPDMTTVKSSSIEVFFSFPNSIHLRKESKPVTNAFCSCPLKPVAQGFTVTTLLLRNMKIPRVTNKKNNDPAMIPVNIRTL